MCVCEETCFKYHYTLSEKSSKEINLGFLTEKKNKIKITIIEMSLK